LSADTYDIVIALGTRDRPQMLKKTLQSFQGLQLPDNSRVCLLVVDNNENRSAEAIFQQVASILSIDSIYVCEPERGIIAMRNRAVEEAINLQAQYMAFIDDDEEVFDQWLVIMFEALLQYHADVAVAGVNRVLPADTPQWVIKGRYFERPHFPTGTPRTAASTSNVLFKLKICKEWGLRFHPALRWCGSSDTFLFNQAYEKGAKIIWVKEGAIQEEIPESRANLSWILKRSFRHASAKVARMRLKYGYLKAFGMESLYGLSQLFWGMVELPGVLIWGKVGWVNALRKIYKFAGAFAGLAGYKYPEYKKTHGH